MAPKTVKALMLAIKNRGISALSWEDQLRVAKVVDLLKALPAHFDNVDRDTLENLQNQDNKK